MSASYVALAVTLPDLQPVYPILEYGSPAERQNALLDFIADPFDEEYADDMVLEDLALEGESLVLEFQCSTGLCNEIAHALFEGLSELEGKNMLAVEYNSRIGMYTCMVPGFDEAEYADECFDDFDGMMHELEEIMDSRERLIHVLRLTEEDPVRSALREFLDEAEEEPVEEEPEEVQEAGQQDVYEPDTSSPSGDDTSPMDELKQALADGDEEKFKALFEQIQSKPGDEA